MRKKLQIAIIGIPGAWSSEILKEAFESKSNAALSVLADVFRVSDLVFSIRDNKVFYGEKDLESYDAVVIKKLGEYAPRILDWLDIFSNLEDKGLPFYSSPKKLRGMISRIGCTKSLAANNIPMPDTLITENSEAALEWIKSKAGAVFKPNFSTKARGMEILKGKTTNLEKLNQLKREFGLLYLQEMVDLPGQDFGVVFSGGKYLGTYARVGDKDSWNTTTQDGGHYAAFEPSEEILALAQKTQAIFGLDFSCVDIAETPNGPIVFEVSAFGGFKGLYKGAKIDSADVLSQFVIEKMNP